MPNRGLSLLEVIVILVLVGILGALVLPPICGRGHCTRMLACQSNLQQLYKLGTIYAINHKGEWPPATGENLWLSLRNAVPPLIEPDHAGVLHCDVMDHELGPDETNYRGPRFGWAKTSSGDIICADREGNHGDGESINVMFKDGSILEVASADALWKKCRETLRP